MSSSGALVHVGQSAVSRALGSSFPCALASLWGPEASARALRSCRQHQGLALQSPASASAPAPAARFGASPASRPRSVKLTGQMPPGGRGQQWPALKGKAPAAGQLLWEGRSCGPGNSGAAAPVGSGCRCNAQQRST